MALDRDQIRALYRRRAKRYDLTANLYYLIGFREWSYRKRAVAALGLEPGRTVVEIGCGTGLNFPLLEAAVGPRGRIIGVDMTNAMLERAREKVGREGWENVELVLADAAQYRFPPGVHGILSTFALGLVPAYDQVIRRGAEALAPGGRWVVADLKLADGPARVLTPLLLRATRPFGVTLDLAERRPWESMARYLPRVTFEERFLGFVYICVGERSR